MNPKIQILFFLFLCGSTGNLFSQNDLYFIAKKHLEKKEFNEAVEVYSQSLKEEEDYRTYMGRAQAYIGLSKNDKAIKDYSRAIDMNPEDSRIHYNRGKCFLDMGEEQAAFADFNKAIELDPANYNAYNSRGYIYFIKDSLQKAEEDYLRAIQVNLNFRLAYMNLAELYVKKGQQDVAIELIAEYLQFNKDDFGALNFLGDLYSRQGSFSVAVRFYFASLEVERNQPEVIERVAVILVEKIGNFEHAMEFISNVSQVYQSLLLDYLLGESYMALQQYDKADSLFNKVREGRKPGEFEKVDLLLVSCLYEQKKYSSCKLILDSLEKANSKNFEVYVQRSMVDLELGELKSSLKYLDKAIAINPQTKLYLQKAYLLNQIGKPKKAMELYNTLDSSSAHNSDVYRSKAFLFDQMELKDSAAFYLYKSVVHGDYQFAGKYRNDRMKDLDSNQEKVLQILSLMLVYKKKGMVYRDRKDFDFLIEQEPEIFDFRLWRGIFFKSAKEYDSAIKDFSKCIEISPERFEGYFFSSNSMLEKGDTTGYLTTIGLGLYKTNAVELLYSRALFYKRTGDIEYAFKDLKKILSMSPEYDNAYYQLGLLFIEAKEKEKACKYLKQAILYGNSNASLEYRISCQ